MSTPESNRPATEQDRVMPQDRPARAAYGSPKLVRLSLAETEGFTGGGGDGIAQNSVPT